MLGSKFYYQRHLDFYRKKERTGSNVGNLLFTNNLKFYKYMSLRKIKRKLEREKKTQEQKQALIYN